MFPNPLARRSLVALLVSVAVLGGCGLEVQRGVEVEASPAAVGDAAARTVSAGGLTYSAVLAYDVQPAEQAGAAFLNGIEITLAGRYESESGRLEASLDPDSFSGIGAGVVGDIATVTDPEAGAFIVQDDPPNGPWVQWDLATLNPQPGGALVGSARMATLLELVGLSEAAVEAGGQAEVGGVDTAVLSTSFVPSEVLRGESDTVVLQVLTGYADLAPMLDTPVPVELYVDQDRIVRRLVATFDLAPVLAASGMAVQVATERVQLDVAAVGAGEAIEVPAGATASPA